VIVSRTSENYPKFIEKRFKNIDYRDVSGDDFITQSSIFANIILFNTGSINEQINKYSIPIIPVTTKYHEFWDPSFENKSVILNLLYYCDDEKKFIPNFDNNLEFFKKFDRGNSISNVMEEIIRAVKELENKMLSEKTTIAVKELENKMLSEETNIPNLRNKKNKPQIIKIIPNFFNTTNEVFVGITKDNLKMFIKTPLTGRRKGVKIINTNNSPIRPPYRLTNTGYLINEVSNLVKWEKIGILIPKIYFYDSEKLYLEFFENSKNYEEILRNNNKNNIDIEINELIKLYKQLIKISKKENNYNYLHPDPLLRNFIFCYDTKKAIPIDPAIFINKNLEFSFFLVEITYIFLIDIYRINKSYFKKIKEEILIEFTENEKIMIEKKFINLTF
jgi:hypothetical protein